MNFRRLIHSLHHAILGFVFVFRHEQNFRIQLVAAAAVIVLAVALRVSAPDRVALLLLIFAVLSLELLNSAIEWLVDIVKPRLHDQVARVKDIMAAAVLLVSACAAFVGLMIFWPYVVRFVSG